jgi:phosphotransferase system  glucose/maltose/N-acetylglucosamine-specific IIC component
MKLSAPKQVVFVISVILIILGLIASLVFIPFVSGISNWVTFAGGALLSLGCLLKGI